MTTTNTDRSHVMQMARGLYRAHLGSAAPITFGDALAAAWRCRRSAAWETLNWIDTPRPRRLRPRSMVRRPMHRAAAGRPWAAVTTTRADYPAFTLGH